MPKYTRTNMPFSLVAWFYIILIIVLVFSMIYKYPFIILVFPVLAVWVYSDNKNNKKKYNSLLIERQELSICEFSRSFNCKEIDTWVIRAVYEQIQAYVSSENTLLPIKAQDNLFEILDIDEEDLELDIVEEIMQRTGRTMEDSCNNPYYDKVCTVKDLVLFVNEQPLEKNT